ncbi:NADP-dependent fatty aldehyde dehydrogenase [Anatilimnocola aggregata]|uniref:NADP-dependent fatty aldehyde dehydrogenase n=1 Tax=Anatilimnocola aggregata TaxID=2528021 RepID=A0A517Y5K2_9BACT|nr:aldehyde dehydrogenase (NADP(+)) [Anatilimnocola aggregata]QDU25515.1 NADP-dependent fatty aldehyde dehydrogenase [Anatilimnocola aggregata]
MSLQPVLIAGEWRASNSSSSFQAENPATQEKLPAEFPISSWADCDAALAAATSAAAELRALPAERIAEFLEAFARRIEARKDEFVKLANQESALPASPRLADNEFPRTTGQLRQAAAAARDGSWSMPTIDAANNIRSVLAPIGPVLVFGPNNFPFAFNSAAGGDFAAAIAAGNPVIAKANTSHPGTSQLFAEEALAALKETKLPLATVQLIYRTSHADGEKLVADHRVGAIGYTGSRHAGLKLKAAADATGKPFYAELSSVNPVVILPGALAEKAEELAATFTTSCLMGVGQFCTNPGLIVLLEGSLSETFITDVTSRFQAAPVGTLLSSGVATSLTKAIAALQDAGAKLLVGGTTGGGKGHSFANTLLRVSGDQFVHNAAALQTEAFGNASLLVVVESVVEAAKVLAQLEGNLTGCIYSSTTGKDDEAYAQLAPILRQKVGRLLDDKMPTGVAVSPAMNHGGPFPATGHPGFTAVGIPASLRRFAMLQCYDSVRENRLPASLKNKNPSGKLWRQIGDQWTQADVG